MKTKGKAVIFVDFDSCWFKDESLDEILKLFPLSDKINYIDKICRQGMGGNISQAESIRLRLLHGGVPTQENIDQYIAKNKERVIQRISNALREEIKKNQVYVVSGGFREVINPLLDGVLDSEFIRANPLDVIRESINTNNLDLESRDSLDQYILVKEAVIKEIMESYNDLPCIMIGDSVTDFRVYTSGAVTHFLQAAWIKNRNKVCEAMRNARDRSKILQIRSEEDFYKWFPDILDCVENKQDIFGINPQIQMSY